MVLFAKILTNRALSDGYNVLVTYPYIKLESKKLPFS